MQTSIRFLHERRSLARTIALLTALGIAALWLSSAKAAVATSTMNVSAGVVSACEVAGAPGSGYGAADLDFGTRDVLSGAAANAATANAGAQALTIVCNSATGGATLTVGLGQNAVGTQRRLVGPGGTQVDYMLYRDSGHTQSVGVTPLNLPALSGGAPYVLVLYGAVPAPQQASQAGAYVDVVSLTLNY